MEHFSRFFGLFQSSRRIPNATTREFYDASNEFTNTNYISWSSWVSLEEGLDVSYLRNGKLRFIAGAVDPVTDLEDVNLDDRETTEPETKSPLKKYLTILKIVLLFLIWTIAAVCVLFSPESNTNIQLLSVPPGSKGGELEVPSSFVSRNGFVAMLQGPFQMADDISDDDLNTYKMTTELQFISNGNREVLDSKSLSLASDFENAPVVMKRITLTVPEIRKAGTLVLNVVTNVDKYVMFKVELARDQIGETTSLIAGIAILIGLYVLIIWEIVNRTFAAILASTVALGALSVIEGRPSVDEIIGWVDVETMLLLFGLMVLVAILSETGIFDYMAVFAYRLSRGQIWPLINCLCLFVSMMSAFLDNVTMMLLVTPVVIRLCEVNALNPVPILMCMVVFSNIGACTTPVGDPPNVIIALNPVIIQDGVTFIKFTMHMLPGVIFAMIQSYIHLRIVFRKDSSFQYSTDAEIEEIKHEIGVWEYAAAGITAFSKDEEAVKESLLKKVKKLKALLKEKTAKAPQAKLSFEETLDQLAKDYPIRNHVLLYKSLVAFTFVIACFFLHSLPYFHDMSLAWSALLGAIMLIILADIEDLESILMRVEWSTMIFFAALFILMEALSSMGVIEVVGRYTIRFVLGVKPRHRLLAAILIIVWISGLSSALLSNIPVATMMVKIVVTLSQNKELGLPLQPLVWALAFGVCFGGNGTLIAATANIVSAGVVEQYGYKISFMQFFFLGFPIMLGELLVVSVYLYIAHILFQWH